MCLLNHPVLLWHPWLMVFHRVLSLVLYYLFSTLLKSELPNIISPFSLDNQIYADDSYIYSSFSDFSLDPVVNKIKSCLHTIISWSSSMCLELNPDKFELIYFNKSSKSFLLPSLALPPPSSLYLVPSPSIRSLGFILDAHLSDFISTNSICF